MPHVVIKTTAYASATQEVKQELSQLPCTVTTREGGLEIDWDEIGGIFGDLSPRSYDYLDELLSAIEGSGVRVGAIQFK